ncbi:cysteine desulfurase [Alicyclobacillaceae bacterium I2511]|nr:cysteine desulfurase [Alicyclobacillaceae bacterium I2511]
MKRRVTLEIYLDNAATTPLLPEVEAVMMAAFQQFGNPSSLHRKGVQAEDVVRRARQQVLHALGVNQGKLVFTGSGTEANNLAIIGVIRRYANRGRHIVTTSIEHSSVLEVYRYLERRGWDVTFVNPDATGQVQVQDILSALRPDTLLVSMMHVNNETGALLPVQQVGVALKTQSKTLFHVDGIQSFGKVPDCLVHAQADLYTVSAHKLGGPKGVGALYLRQALNIDPLLWGGGQEFGLRSGTENVAGIAGFGIAAAQAAQDLPDSWNHVRNLYGILCDGLKELGAHVISPFPFSPYIVNASFPGIRAEVFLHALEAQGVYVSTGSACSTHKGRVQTSHVLQAMGISLGEATGAVRFSLARWQTPEDIQTALQRVAEQVQWVHQVGG